MEGPSTKGVSGQIWQHFATFVAVWTRGNKSKELLLVGQIFLSYPGTLGNSSKMGQCVTHLTLLQKTLTLLQKKKKKKNCTATFGSTGFHVKE